MSADTQHLIRDGYECEITSTDKAFLPDMALWELRHLATRMSVLVGAAAPRDLLGSPSDTDPMGEAAEVCNENGYEDEGLARFREWSGGEGVQRYEDKRDINTIWNDQRGKTS